MEGGYWWLSLFRKVFCDSAGEGGAAEVVALGEDPARVAVNQERCRDARDAVVVGQDGAARVDLGPGQAFILDELADAVGGHALRLVKTDADDLESARAVLLVRAGEVRLFGAAGGAPGGPEVEEDQPALVGDGEVDRLTGKRLRLEGAGDVADGEWTTRTGSSGRGASASAELAGELEVGEGDEGQDQDDGPGVLHVHLGGRRAVDPCGAELIIAGRGRPGAAPPATAAGPCGAGVWSCTPAHRPVADAARQWPRPPGGFAGRYNYCRVGCRFRAGGSDAGRRG